MRQQPARYLKIFITSGVIIVCCALLIYILLPEKKNQTAEDVSYSTPQIVADKESAQVYIKDLYKYEDTISPDTISKVKNMLYQYAYRVGGNDLYTGILREGSFTTNRLSNGSITSNMVIDVSPISITYEVSIAKNKQTNNQESFLIACAPKDEQKSTKNTCIDEQGR